MYGTVQMLLGDDGVLRRCRSLRQNSLAIQQGGKRKQNHWHIDRQLIKEYNVLVWREVLREVDMSSDVPDSVGSFVEIDKLIDSKPSC